MILFLLVVNYFAAILNLTTYFIDGGLIHLVIGSLNTFAALFLLLVGDE